MTVLVSNADVNVSTYQIQTYLNPVASDMGFEIKIKINEEKSVMCGINVTLRLKRSFLQLYNASILISFSSTYLGIIFDIRIMCFITRNINK